MHSVKLTILLDDTDDLDMEVRLVVPSAEHAADNVTPLHARVTAVPSRSVDDDYALGGYAGI